MLRLEGFDRAPWDTRCCGRPAAVVEAPAIHPIWTHLDNVHIVLIRSTAWNRDEHPRPPGQTSDTRARPGHGLIPLRVGIPGVASRLVVQLHPARRAFRLSGAHLVLNLFSLDLNLLDTCGLFTDMTRCSTQRNSGATRPGWTSGPRPCRRKRRRRRRTRIGRDADLGDGERPGPGGPRHRLAQGPLLTGRRVFGGRSRLR